MDNYFALRSELLRENGEEIQHVEDDDSILFNEDGLQRPPWSRRTSEFLSNSKAKDLLSSDRLFEMKLDGIIWSSAFQPYGGHFAVGDQKGNVTIINAATFKMETIFHKGDVVRALSYSPDGSQLAVGGDDKRLSIHDVTNDYAIIQQEDFSETIRALSYSPDGSRLAFAGKGGKLALYNTATKSVVKEIRMKTPIWSLAYSPPDGEHISVAGEDRNITVYNSKTLVI